LENPVHCIFFKAEVQLLNTLRLMKKFLALRLRLSQAGLCLGLWAVGVGAFAQDAEIKKSESLINEDKKLQAVDVLQKAVAQYPQAANLYYYLGHSQLLTGDQAGAKNSFDKGVETNPKEPLNYVGLGRILLLEKKVDQAKPLFDKALSLGKKSVVNLQAIAEAEILDKTLSKNAFTLLQKAKELEPNNSRTYLLLSDYYLSENNGGATASAQEDAAAIDPSNAKPWFKHAMLFKRSKNMAVVEEDLNKALKIDPNFALAHKELGELYYLKKDGVNAAKHYKSYLDLTDSPEKDDRFRYAFFLFMAKDYAGANQEFKNLSQKSDVSSTTLKFYAQSLLKQGDLAGSQKVFEQYMSNPQTKLEADDYSNYAELLQQQHKDSLAAIAFHQSLAMDKDQPEILQTLMDYYFKSKKYDQCASVSREAIKIRKKPYANDYFVLGRALYLSKKYTQSDSAFAKLIELQPKLTLGYLWAARSKTEQDEELKDGLAKPYYEKIIEIASATPDKNKNELIAAYQYMGSYHLIKQENQIAKGYWEKVLALNPDDENAKEAMKLINNPGGSPAPKKKNK